MSIPTTDIHVAEISLRAHLLAEGGSQQACVNVFHYRRIATAVDPSKSALATIFQSTIVAALIALVHQDYEVESIGVRWIDDALDPEIALLPGGAAVGALSTADSPDHNAIAYYYKTALRGRNFRGRKSFGGIAAATIDGDVIAAASLAAWQSFATTLVNPLTDSDGNVWAAYVLSRELSALQSNPTIVDGADVIQVILNKNITTMNSRKIATVR